MVGKSSGRAKRPYIKPLVSTPNDSAPQSKDSSPYEGFGGGSNPLISPTMFYGPS
jgi:hypothetical protein